ncbi:hypothetical protein [Falsihalocynthiibacter arcticus]|uniref:hypothetical protein n=1 Tax=Falsihalocynthiibacter arcticus TaxID=1579316 RepID=UPI0012E6F347|nr:hypothetical protein [Falsihalocynthiibacter arcticus]
MIANVIGNKPLSELKRTDFTEAFSIIQKVPARGIDRITSSFQLTFCSLAFFLTAFYVSTAAKACNYAEKLLPFFLSLPRHTEVPFIHERNFQLQSTHQKFRISAYAAEFIKMSRFSAQTARLFYALIFLQDQTDESWPSISIKSHKPESHFVFVGELRDLCFPARTGSSRFLRKLKSISIIWLIVLGEHVAHRLLAN